MPHSVIGFLFATGATIFVLSLWTRGLKAIVAPPLVILALGLVYRFVAAPDLPRATLMIWLETLAWLAVGFGVMSIALRLHARDLPRLLRPGALIIGIAMLGMWGASTLILGGVLRLPLAHAAILGAIVTPTDPVIASSIVTGDFAEAHVPARVRTMLAFESGANDGLGFPFLFLPLLLLGHGMAGWSEWAIDIVALKIVATGIAAIVIGNLGCRLIAAALAREHVGERSIMLLSLTFTVALLALAKLFDVDSIWAAFLAGLAFTWGISDRARSAADAFQEGGNYLAMVPALFLFALALPLAAWATLWPLGLAALVLLLLFRRLPVIALLYALMRPRGGTAGEACSGVDPHPFRHPRDLWFYGWFGPLGLSAVFYAAAAQRELGGAAGEMIWAVASLLVTGSILVHGLTAAPFTRWYGRAAARAG